jgi:hypothetical protein
MENLLSFLAAAFSSALEKRTTGKLTIGAPGCTLTVHKPPTIHRIDTEEGYPAYIGQSKIAESTYGFATVILPVFIDNHDEVKHKLYVLLEDVYSSFRIEYGTGLSYGYNHPGDEAIFGFTEYWQDKDGMDWKVKAWTNGKVMTVLYIRNIGSVSLKDQDSYLDGISFSEGGKLYQ